MLFVGCHGCGSATRLALTFVLLLKIARCPPHALPIELRMFMDEDILHLDSMHSLLAAAHGANDMAEASEQGVRERNALQGKEILAAQRIYSVS